MIAVLESAAMDPERVKELARKGGVAAHAQGVAHKWSTDQAREAGRKGGVAPHRVRGRGPKQQSLPTGDAE